MADSATEASSGFFKLEHIDSSCFTPLEQNSLIPAMSRHKDNQESSDIQANTVGITCLTSFSLNNDSWILDTGETNHMSSRSNWQVDIGK